MDPRSEKAAHRVAEDGVDPEDAVQSVVEQGESEPWYRNRNQIRRALQQVMDQSKFGLREQDVVSATRLMAVTIIAEPEFGPPAINIRVEVSEQDAFTVIFKVEDNKQRSLGKEVLTDPSMEEFVRAATKELNFALEEQKIRVEAQQ